MIILFYDKEGWRLLYSVATLSKTTTTTRKVCAELREVEQEEKRGSRLSTAINVQMIVQTVRTERQQLTNTSLSHLALVKI